MAPIRILAFSAARAILVAGLLSSCGPDLLAPADSSVTGSWALAGSVPNLSQIRVDMTQGDGGRIEGSWSGITDSGRFGCLKATCEVGGMVRGVNTALQVYLEIVGAGDFTGQLVSPTYLRGSIATPDAVAVELRRELARNPAVRSE